MTTAEPPAVIRAWRVFHRWRQRRPFWGGLLTILAGLEIFATTQQLGALQVKIGLEGFQATLIPLMLILAGVLAWVTPAQRHFYGVVTAFVAVFSLIGVNFGGFFIGMLLGIVGGGLVFAWAPTASPVSPAADEGEPDGDQPSGRHAAVVTVDELLDGREPARSAAGTGVPQVSIDADEADQAQQPGRVSGLLTLITVPLVLAASVTFAVNSQQPALAACDTVPTPASSPVASPVGGSSPSDVPTTTAPAASPTGGSDPSDPPATMAPAAFTAMSAEPSPSQIGETPPPATTPGASATTVPVPAPTTRCPSPGSPGRPAKRLTAAANQVDVAVKPGRMRGSRVTMVNLNFRGIVDLPTANGTITVLKFTMDSSTTDDFSLRIYGNGWDVLQSTRKLTVGEGVAFYTSRFQGNILGLIPVDYTPTAPPPSIPLPLVFFTNPDIQLVLVDSGKLTAKPNLTMSFVSAG